MRRWIKSGSNGKEASFSIYVVQPLTKRKMLNEMGAKTKRDICITSTGNIRDFERYNGASRQQKLSI